MSHLQPLDPAFPIERQLGVDATPVVLVNVFTLDKADEQAFLETWQVDAAFMMRQPGFISTQLHRAIGEGPTYLNYAVWESTALFKAAFMQPEFRAAISHYPASAVARRTCSRKSPCRASASHSRRAREAAEARCTPRPRAAQASLRGFRKRRAPPPRKNRVRTGRGIPALLA